MNTARKEELGLGKGDVGRTSACAFIFAYTHALEHWSLVQGGRKRSHTNGGQGSVNISAFVKYSRARSGLLSTVVQVSGAR